MHVLVLALLAANAAPPAAPGTPPPQGFTLSVNNGKVTMAVTPAKPVPAVAPVAPVAAAPVGPKVSLQFSGPLKEGLRQLAEKGGLNLVATGDLSQPAEIHLKDVSAEDALTTVADSYHLAISHKGSIWTLRPMTKDEVEEAADRQKDAAEAEKDAAMAQKEAARAQEEAAKEQEDEAKEDSKDDDDEANALPTPPTPPTPPGLPGALPPMPPQMSDRDVKGLKKLERKLMKLKKHGQHENEVVGTGPVVVESGKIVDSAVSYGGSVTVKSGGVVEGDAVAMGGDVVLEKDSVVEGDAVSFGGQIRKDDGAIVEGDETTFGGPTGAVVSGLSHADHLERHASASRPGLGGLQSSLLLFGLYFGVGFLFMMFVPQRMKLIQAELVRQPWRCAATGLLGFLAYVVLMLLSIITLVGPFVLALIAVTLWAMGMVALALEIGARLPIFKGRKTQAAALALGALFVILISRLPVGLGVSLVTLGSAIALGAIIRTRVGTPPKNGMPVPDPVQPPTAAAA